MNCEKVINCMDCNRISTLKKVSACSDSHIGTVCCYKLICNDYCIYTCTKCENVNKLSYENISMFDNYYDGYECWSCKYVNLCVCNFNGDLKTNCERYCQSNCFPEHIIIKGKE